MSRLAADLRLDHCGAAVPVRDTPVLILTISALSAFEMSFARSRNLVPSGLLFELSTTWRASLERTIIGEFDTRRGAELAVEHVVQECGNGRCAPNRDRGNPLSIQRV
jgi:hypothetical protein